MARAKMGVIVINDLHEFFADSGPLARLPPEATERREAAEAALKALRHPERMPV